MKILICSDGSPHSVDGVRFVRLFQFPRDTPIVLFHVLEARAKTYEKHFNFAPLLELFESQYTNIQTKTKKGNAANQILLEVSEGGFNLVVSGDKGLGHSFLHRRIGKTVNRLIKQIETPFLVVRSVPHRIKKVLMCTGGESFSEENLERGAKLLGFIDADVGILHVMSQLALKLSPLPMDLLDTAQSAIQRGTREGSHLARAIEIVRKAGVKGEIRPILRHGLVLEQVIQELREGKYDLLVVGSHHVEGRHQLFEMLLEDVAGNILAEASCSVLIV